MKPAPLPLAVLLALLASQATQGEDAGRELSLQSRSVELERLPRSPRRALVAAQPVGQLLELDGEPFSLELDGERLRVATRAREAPDRSLRDAAVLTLAWERDGEPRRREVRFEPEPAGGWVYGAPRARLFELEDETLVLVDADLDGELDLLHDAWGTAPGAPLMPLSPILILGDRELRLEQLARDGSRLQGRLTPLAGNAVQRAALRRLNRLRCADGLGAVRLEPELSAGCTAHAEYLAAQAWTGGGDPHEQDPRAEKASREGRAAARRSQILPLAPAAAVDALWSSLHGRRLLADPDLVALGLSGSAAGIAVLDLESRATKKSLGRRAWLSTLLSPADGAHGQPTSYDPAGRAAPVEGAERMGPPLLAFVREPGADIEHYAAELYKLSGQSRRKQRTVSLDSAAALGQVRGVLPARPLDEASRYLVVHRFTIDGEELRREARFRTR